MGLPTPLQAFSGAPKGTSPSGEQTITAGEKMTGARALVRALEDLGVQDVFGIPGNEILPVFDALQHDAAFKFITACHEQAAGHAAEGYALATGKVGVCIVSSGPGATNIVTAVADANMDSVPLIVITGQVSASAIGTDAFQETDIVGITYPVVKHSFLVTRAQDVPRVMTEAHFIARSGRPGPVVVDLSKTAQTDTMYYSWPQRMILPGYNPTTKAHGRVLSDSVKLFSRSYRPVLIVGGGAVRSDAGSLVKQLADLTNTPVVTTLPARGVIPDSDPKSLGLLGKYGSIAATGAVQHSDLVVAIGTRFADHATGSLSTFAPTARVIHIDIDPAEIGKNRQPDVPIVGDVAMVLKDLIPEVERAQAIQTNPDRAAWWEQIHAWQTKYPTVYEEPNDGTLAPQWVVEQLSKAAEPNTLWVSDAGQHQVWTAQFVDFERSHSWVSSNGLGTTGSGLPEAIGAAIGSARAFEGSKPVWLVVGDGGFQMSSQELATAALEHTPIRIAILNNSVYGMARQTQTLFYDSHYSHTTLSDGSTEEHREAIPDFVTLAQAYGCKGLRVTTKQEALDAIAEANATHDRPVLIDFRVWKDAMVWPLVPEGASNDDVMYRQGITPLSSGPDQHSTTSEKEQRS